MIKPYYCTRDGYLTKRGECEEVFIKDIPEPDETLHYGIPPKDIVLAPNNKSWKELRREAYPSFANQLDALWHAMAAGVIPRVEPIFSEILAVKEKYPKPSN